MAGLPDNDSRPLKEVKIVNCGEVKLGQDWGLGEKDGTEDTFPYHPDDLDIDWYLQENFSKVLDIVFKIRIAGNLFFQQKDFASALRKYNKALRYIHYLRDAMGSTGDEEEKEIRAVEVPCCLNLAAANLKRGEYQLALVECDKVLEIEPSNSKALFRRGQARFGMQDYELAVKDLSNLLKRQPHDPSVSLELAKCKKALHSFKESRKRAFAKMFN